MTEYIDKAAAVRILEAKSDMAVCTDAQPYFMVAAKMIGLLPSADVAPVIHARWELCYEDYTQIQSDIKRLRRELMELSKMIAPQR